MKNFGINENHKIYLIDYENNPAHANAGGLTLGATPPSPQSKIKIDYESSPANSKIKLKLLYDNDSWLVSTVGSDCRLGGGKSIKVVKDKIYFISTENDSSYLYSLDLNGKIQKLTEADASVDCFDISSDENKIFYIGMKNYKLQEIYELENNISKQITDFDNNLRSVRGEAPTLEGNSPKDAVAPEKKKVISKQISAFNNKIFENFKISAPEKVLFETNGDTTEGFVIKPVDYDETKTYPAILDIHGGPKTVYGNIFYHEMQVWANLGYFVFFCNPHGSDGKGNIFADIRGKYGTVDYEDIMNWTEYVLKSYPIDKNRVGVTGGSYGGYMTNWIIGHTDRFKCAVSQRSISNWISKFGATDIG
ncbi:MAG: S9 family peptidase, partial [Fusobacterium sp.]|nr:S9 family peptidase [Fusobacterium sp.]